MDVLVQFFNTFWHYFIEILPFLAVGFLISGLVHEFIPTEWIGKHLGKKGMKPIFYATLVGTLLPVCCMESLPVAISFYKKGARLGAILAFLVATPATSIPALLVTYELLGFQFTLFLSFSVILLGLMMGLVGNLFSPKPRLLQGMGEGCGECGLNKQECACPTGLISRIRHCLRFAFWEMPKEIGRQMLLGLGMAALIITMVPGGLITSYLTGAGGYIAAVIFGLALPICATASVPLVHALVLQGINVGAALTLLLVGPITNISHLLVLWKAFGRKVVLVYLTVVLTVALLAGLSFSLL